MYSVYIFLIIHKVILYVSFCFIFFLIGPGNG